MPSSLFFVPFWWMRKSEFCFLLFLHPQGEAFLCRIGSLDGSPFTASRRCPAAVFALLLPGFFLSPLENVLEIMEPLAAEPFPSSVTGSPLVLFLFAVSLSACRS